MQQLDKKMQNGVGNIYHKINQSNPTQLWFRASNVVCTVPLYFYHNSLLEYKLATFFMRQQLTVNSINAPTSSFIHNCKK